MGTDRIPIIVLCAAFIVLGGVFAIQGRMMIERPLSRWVPRATHRMILTRLTTWGILLDDTTAINRNLLVAAVTRVMAWSIAGMGVGALFGALASLIVTLLVTFHGSDTSDAPFVISVQLAFECVISGMVIGAATGHIRSVRLLSSLWSQDSARQSQRRVSDYASPALWCVIFAIYGLVAAIYVIADAQSPGLDVSWMGSAPDHWSGMIVGGAQAFGVVVIPLIALLCACWIARSPDLLIEIGHDVTVRLSDLLRARAMVSVVSAPALIGYFMYGLSIPFEARAGALGALYHAAPFIVPFLAILPLGFFALGSEGAQLGGRLTGWPWQRLPEQRERAVPEEGD